MTCVGAEAGKNIKTAISNKIWRSSRAQRKSTVGQRREIIIKTEEQIEGIRKSSQLTSANPRQSY